MTSQSINCSVNCRQMVKLLFLATRALLVLNLLCSRITGCVYQQLGTYWAHNTDTATHAAASNTAAVTHVAGFHTNTTPV